MNDFDRDDKLETLGGIVERDYRRVQKADDPFLVLDVAPDASFDDIENQFERYERFYTADKFESLENEKLAAKRDELLEAFEDAFDKIRKKFSANQSRLEESGGEDVEDELALTVTEEKLERDILADTYFNDGLTYHDLEDLDRAASCFQKALDYRDGKSGIEAFSKLISYEIDQLAEHLRDLRNEEGDNPAVQAANLILDDRRGDNVPTRNATKHLERLGATDMLTEHVVRQI